MHILESIALLTLISMAFCYVVSDEAKKNVNDEKFDYFAYGSNLLARRLHIGNPSAKFYSAAKLKGYRLDFNIQSDVWRGAVATICKDSDSEVWGALWHIDIKHLATLDNVIFILWANPKAMLAIREVINANNGVEAVGQELRQEGVDTGLYYPLNVMVTTENGTQVEARTYIETTPCPPRVTELPPERQPSVTYHKVIVVGAGECGLPTDYITYVNDTIKTNGLLASDTIIKQLGDEFR